MLPAALRRRLEGSKNRKANGTEHPETRQREPETQNELKEQIIKKSLIKMTRNWFWDAHKRPENTYHYSRHKKDFQKQIHFFLVF